MSRRKSNAAADEQAAAPQTEAAQEASDTSAPAQLPANDAAPTEERQPGDEPAEAPKRPYQPVRGWTQRYTGPVQYRKFTDDNMRIIAFQFRVAANEKLPDTVLALMRDNKLDKDGQATGLIFQDTRKHGKLWSIPNDVEGRALADKLDFRLSELAQKMETATGKTPF